MGLSLIFLFLGIDEQISIHELISKPTREILGTSELLYHAWVIPYGVLLLAFIMGYSRFLLTLPRQTAKMFLFSGTIFVSGAMGFEMIGGWHVEIYGPDNALYSIYYTCEELLEMLGIAWFIHAILWYDVDHLGGIHINITGNTTSHSQERGNKLITLH